MTVLVYKDTYSTFRHGSFAADKHLYKAIAETGHIVGAWDIKKDEYAKSLITEWLTKDGYQVEFVELTDPRFKQAKEEYMINNPGLTFEGEAY